jgi:hypothetical protein
MPKSAVLLDDEVFRLDIFHHLRDIYTLKIDLSPCEAYLEPYHLVDVLHSMPNLRTLYLTDLNFNEDVQKINGFRKVRVNLVELYCNSEVLDMIECSTLKALNLRFRYKFPEQKKSTIRKFLNQQKGLEIFTLKCLNDFFEHFIDFKFEFELKCFTLFSNTNFRDHKALVNFLENQRHSLESLNIQMYSFEQSKTVIEEILKFVMKKLWKLKSFEIDTIFKGTMKKIELLPLQLSTCAAQTIERFGFNDIFYSVDDNKQLIDLLPKLKHLSFKSCFCKAVELLEYATSKPQLESLKFSNFDCIVSTAKFSNLKEFTVHTFSKSTKAFSSFISRNSKSLERITIGDATNMCLQTVNAICKCENLKYLSINVSGNDLASIMKIFREILIKNKPLTVVFRKYPSIVTFKLPEDRIFWNRKRRLN